MPVGDLPGWKQVFADDFDRPVPLGSFTTSSYASTFFPYSGYGDTSGRGWYDANKVVSVSGGLLDFYLHSENGTHYVAALVPHVAGRWGQTYGRYSIRFRADVISGYKLAAILWPDSNDWAEGEIDFPEVDNLIVGKPVYAALHPIGSGGVAGAPLIAVAPADAAASGWHTATIEWAPGSVTAWFDGAKVGAATTGVPNTSFHLVLQLETNLYTSAPDDATTGHVQIDWVTFYSRT